MKKNITGLPLMVPYKLFGYYKDLVPRESGEFLKILLQ